MKSSYLEAITPGCLSRLAGTLIPSLLRHFLSSSLSSRLLPRETSRKHIVEGTIYGDNRTAGRRLCSPTLECERAPVYSRLTVISISPKVAVILHLLPESQVKSRLLTRANFHQGILLRLHYRSEIVRIFFNYSRGICRSTIELARIIMSANARVHI